MGAMKIITYSISEFLIVFAAVILGIHVKTFGDISGLDSVYKSLFLIGALIVVGIVLKFYSEEEK